MTRKKYDSFLIMVLFYRYSFLSLRSCPSLPPTSKRKNQSLQFIGETENSWTNNNSTSGYARRYKRTHLDEPLLAGSSMMVMMKSKNPTTNKTEISITQLEIWNNVPGCNYMRYDVWLARAGCVTMATAAY